MTSYMLRDVSDYIEGELDSGTSVTSVIFATCPDSTSNPHLSFTVELRDGRNEGRLLHDYVEKRSVMQVVRKLVVCPTWRHAQFEFSGLGLDKFIVKIYALISCCPSLKTLEIRSERDSLYHRHLPRLLCGNSFLETLILNPGVTPWREDSEALALCFVRNSVLRSCTLEANYGNSQTWEMALRPFTAAVKGDRNECLKELIVQEARELAGLGAISGEALAHLVRWNTTLERLEVRSSSASSNLMGTGNRLAKSLGINCSLKVFGCVGSIVFLEELDGVFTPDSSGHQANTHLTTLRLEPILGYNRLGDYINKLSRLLQLNSTLEHVEIVLSGVDNSSEVWEVRCWKPPQCHEKVSIQDMLEMMIRNELKRNTRLQSLVVGSWKLFREGGKWKMSYGGPCRARTLQTAEYNVKVTICQ
ncbi:hypothetical protein KC19_10G072400 [Ceratodon purpureus]|uniref:Uncharacterized protein n=1 Tax=Ceratodon purpureus TaxID=3225 RepID=A0A8T0GLA6_CERPU|nr:hypothetical protein KC19_10G072400 [Ceratodon purpureus]